LNCGQRYAKVLGLEGYYGVTDAEKKRQILSILKNYDRYLSAENGLGSE